MDDLQNAIEGVLKDPEMMEKIMGMAQMFGNSQNNASENGGSPEAKGEIPDLSKIQDLGSLLNGAAMDSDQQNLLKALTPYLSGPHISRLRRAMQAAKLAELANSMLGSSLRGGNV